MSSGLKRSLHMSQRVGPINASMNHSLSSLSLSTRESMGSDYFERKRPTNVQRPKEHVSLLLGLRYPIWNHLQHAPPVKRTLADKAAERKVDLNSMHNAQWKAFQGANDRQCFCMNPLLLMLESRENNDTHSYLQEHARTTNEIPGAEANISQHMYNNLD